MSRGHVGTLLSVLGVLAWAPFIIGRALGGDPPFLAFLPLHLAGVLGGAWLRRGAPRSHVARTRRFGNYLIYAGVSAWIPYFTIEAFAEKPPLLPFLIPHLSGVVPGVTLRYWEDIRRLWERIAGIDEREPAEGTVSRGSSPARAGSRPRSATRSRSRCPWRPGGRYHGRPCGSTRRPGFAP